MTDEIERFWDDCHTDDVLASLSGCEYDATVDFLRVRERVRPGASVLEIGVGMGLVTKALSEIGAQVDGLDISGVGLERVRPYCRQTFQIGDVEQLPSDFYDLIICHNVVQHVPTSALKTELTQAIRALKADGVLALEFVSSDSEVDSGANPSATDVANGILCRTPAFMAQLLADCGGSSETVYSASVDIDVVKGVHVFHVTRAASGSEATADELAVPGIVQVSRDSADTLVKERVVSTSIVIDVGPGIRPQEYFVADVHLCIEAHRPYLERLRVEHSATRFVLINASWREGLGLFLDNSVDTVFALDFIEHLERDEGLAFLAEAERVARRQIVVFTPLGFFQQDYNGPEDRWGMDGGWWQTHRSGWFPEDFDGWDIILSPDFIEQDEFNQPLDEPAGAFWAIKNLGATEE